MFLAKVAFQQLLNVCDKLVIFELRRAPELPKCENSMAENQSRKIRSAP
jgi:hypothetical protein